MKALQGVGEHLVKRGGQWAFSLVMDGVRAHGSNNSLGGRDSMSWFWRHRQGCESLWCGRKQERRGRWIFVTESMVNILDQGRNGRLISQLNKTAETTRLLVWRVSW